MNLIYYLDHGWGTYKELIELTMKDFIEFRIAIESKQQEEQVSQITGGL